MLPPPRGRPIPPMRLWTGLLRVLPDFLIIGAQRGGTTSLYRYLCAHPAVAPAFTKEIHFFDYNFERGVGWYRAHFPTYFDKGRGKFSVTGEASPYYLFFPLAASRAAAIVPQAKLIVLLRNPVERAFSHYYHEVRLGLEPLSAEAAFAAEEARLAGECEKILSDPRYYSFNHQNYSYLARGRYAEQLERWFRYFSRQQFLILASEEFYRDPATIFSRVLEFLELPQWQPDSFPPENQGAYAPMDATLRARLTDYFRPYNARLYELLGTDFGWER